MIDITTFKKNNIILKDNPEYIVRNSILGSTKVNDLGVNMVILTKNNVYEIIKITVFSDDNSDMDESKFLKKQGCESMDEFNKSITELIWLGHFSPFKHDVEKFPPKLI